MDFKNNKGLTLPELLVAAFVAVVAFVSIMGALSNITILNEFDRDITLAAVHGQYIMEELSCAAFGSLETNINNGTWDFNTNQLSTNPYNFTVINAESINTTAVNTGDPLQIRVQVNWQDRRGTGRTYTLETLRTN